MWTNSEAQTNQLSTYLDVYVLNTKFEILEHATNCFMNDRLRESNTKFSEACKGLDYYLLQV